MSGRDVALVVVLSILGASLSVAQVQYREDDAHASGQYGQMCLAVRKDSVTALASADGDYIPFIVDGSGRLWAAAVQSGAWTVSGTGTFLVGDGAGALNVIVDSLPTVTVTDGAGALNTIVDSGTLTCNAGSGTFLVGDGAGVLTVDGTVSIATFPDNEPFRISDGVDLADVLDLASTNPLTVAIVDGSGAQITSFGGGTQYTEADTDATITGTAVMWEDTSDTLRVASAAKPLPVNIISGPAGGDGKILDGTVADQADVEAASLASASLEGLVVRPYPPGDGTLTATIRDTGSADSLNVAIVDASGNHVTSFGGGTQYTEDAAAAADPVGTALNLVRDDALSGQTTTDGDNVAARGTDKGELYVKHVDAIPVTDNAGSLTVDGTVAVSSLPALVAGTANIGDVDVLTVPAPLSTTGGGTEATALRVTLANDSTGVVSVDDNGGALTVDGTVAISSLPASTNTLEVVGDAADGAAVAGNPVRIGGKDGSGNTQDIATDTSGELQVDVLTLPSVTIGTFPDNEPINVAQMNGVAVTMGNGASGTGVQRVTIASDSTGQVAIASFPDNEPVNVAQKGGAAVAAGPCEREVPLYAQVDQSSGEQIITGTASERVYICSIAIVTATAQNIALVDGTGSVCATSPTGLLGGSTAATGQNYAANGGWVLPFSPGAWAKTSTDADNVCLLQSGAGQVSGIITYVSIPNI